MQIIETNWNWNGALTARSKTDYIVLHHAEASKCSAADVDRWHKDNGWSGIGYHFFVRKDGSIYRGRPIWAHGAHVSGKNNCSIGVCAEGRYGIETMPETQKKAICELIVYIKNIYSNAKIVGHREIGDSDCPGKNYPLEDIKANWRKYGCITEYTEANDIIRELKNRGILTDTDLWLQYCKNDSNVYWFCRKLCQYARTYPGGEKADREYKDIGEIIWDWHYRGVITDKQLWTDYMNRDNNVYWLLQKSLHYCRTH